METKNQIVSLLGGPKVLGKKIKSNLDWHYMILEGIPWEAAHYIKKKLDLTNHEIANVLGVSVSTFVRKKRSKDRMSLGVSDRLYRFARIFAEAVEVMGDVDSARTWIHRPHAVFGNRSPIDRMENAIGAEEVETVLGRIRYGVIG